MIQDKIFFDEKDPTGVSYNTPFTVYGSYEGRLWSKTPSGTIKYYTQNSDLSVYATTGSNSFNGNQTVTGSLTVTGGITGSATTASYVEYAGVANKPTLVSSSAQIVGYNVFATTGSNQFNGSQAVTGSLTVTGQVVAQTLNVQQVTSSIVYSSGSNVFGNSVSNTQQFTGSLQVSGSSHYVLGSVGVGTTSLVADALLPLQINAGSSGQAYFASNNNGGYGLLMGYDNANGYARIRNVSNTALTFETNNSEKMRITSGSNVWIGNDTNPILEIANGGSTDVLSGIRWSVGGSRDNYAGIYSATSAAYNGYISFYTRSSISTISERMRITSDGNVGIGTTNPGNFNALTFTSPILDVIGSLNVRGIAANGASVINMGGETYRKAAIFTSIQDQDPFLGFSVGSGGGTSSSTTERLRITSGGNVLIGTTTNAGSNQPLQVVKTGSSNYLRIQTDNNASYDCGLFFTDATNSVFSGMLRGSSGLTGAYSIVTGGTVRLSVTSGGITIVGHTAGVGTNFSPPIQVKGGAGVGNGFGIISAFNEMVGGIQLSSSGTNSLQITADPDNLRSSSDIGFSIDGSIRMTINSNGIVDISGPLVVKGTLPVDQTSAAVIDHFSSKMRIFSYGASGTTGTFEFRNAAGGAGSNLVATINASGVYTAVSDINKKKDFEQSTIGLDAILGLKPTLYRMRNGEPEGDKELGFIAQEVKEFIPQAYVESGEDDDKFIGLNYNAIVAALVKSVQELKSENDTLKSILQRNNIS